MSNNTSPHVVPQEAPTKTSTAPVVTTSSSSPTTSSQAPSKPHDTAPTVPTSTTNPPPTHPPNNPPAQSPAPPPAPSPPVANPNPPPAQPNPNPVPKDPNQDTPPSQPQIPTQVTNSNSPSPAPAPESPAAPNAPAPPDAPQQSSEPSVTLVTITMSPDSPGETAIVTVVHTSTRAVTNPADVTTKLVSTTISNLGSATSTAGLQHDSAGAADNSLSGGGKIAVAVVVPIAAVTVLVLAVIFIFRRRKQRKHAEELRRKEVEEYGYNPNQDPTYPNLSPSLGPQKPHDMQEDNTGYRGWGNTMSPVGRKTSPAISPTPANNMPNAAGIGIAYSEGEHDTHGTMPDTKFDNSLLPENPFLAHQRDSYGAIAPTTQQGTNINRGFSHSSSDSAGNQSGGSKELDGSPFENTENVSLNDENNVQNPSPTSGPVEMAAQPVIRDVQARRNTRIESPTHFPRLHNTGISQNF